ncbi:MAG: hypothetical protein JWO12_1861 [Frankiales bacterium]|nr:hypothetical protein [Frankiales bacterium]
MHRPARTALAGATALLATTLVAGALTTTPANAASVRLPSPHVMKTLDAVKDRVLPTENRLPLIGGAPVGLPLSYGGGAVEVTSTNYAIFWDPAQFSYNPTYPTLVKRFLGDLGGSSIFNTVTEYYQTVNGVDQYAKNVSTFGGAFTVTDPFPAGGVTDADLQRVVKEVVAANHLPTGVGNEYLVYTGQGGELANSYCAYHSYVTIAGQNTAYADELYGGQSGCTTPSSPNGNPAADSIINTSSHEIWETITDPNTGDGWTALDGDEGSDQCNFEFGPTDASGADIRINGNPYIVQQEWRNSAAPFGCVMS